MASPMNIFRILGDVSHTISKCILIWAIHSNKSAEGVSLLTQLLYIAVFGTRYLDLFWVPPWWSWWNFILKIFYIVTSAYIVWLMMRMFARTREKEKAWKLAIWSLGACLVSAPLVCLVFRTRSGWTITEMLWIFSIELESVCVLPQLLLLRQTTVPTVLDSFYLVTLGSYRFFYILNWIVRGASHEPVDPVNIIFGCVQTLFYIDFAWVYWTRQRVKLRGGGVVDADDLSKSFVVRRFIGGRQSTSDDDGVDEESAALARQEDGVIHAPQPRRASNWGPRGISVSADDTLLEHDSAQSGRMVDPAHFEDDDDDDDVAALPPAPTLKKNETQSQPSLNHAANAGGEPDLVGSSAGEWQENTGK